jgi:hypothetical protein|eukprot:SAG25_NODE_615_length_6505_cov_8.659694_4_plen_62_part_00
MQTGPARQARMSECAMRMSQSSLRKETAGQLRPSELMVKGQKEQQQQEEKGVRCYPLGDGG